MHRLQTLGAHFEPAYTAAQATPAASVGGKKDTLSIVDNRTGKIN
jgi:hypothetical protein